MVYIELNQAPIPHPVICLSGWGIGVQFNSKFMVLLMSWFIFLIDSHYKYKYTKFEASNEFFYPHLT